MCVCVCDCVCVQDIVDETTIAVDDEDDFKEVFGSVSHTQPHLDNVHSLYIIDNRA